MAWARGKAGVEAGAWAGCENAHSCLPWELVADFSVVLSFEVAGALCRSGLMEVGLGSRV